jgi:hypothetical protein
LAQEDAGAMARAAHVLANLGKQYDLAKELVDRARRLEFATDKQKKKHPR